MNRRLLQYTIMSLYKVLSTLVIPCQPTWLMRPHAESLNMDLTREPPSPPHAALVDMPIGHEALLDKANQAGRLWDIQLECPPILTHNRSKRFYKHLVS